DDESLVLTARTFRLNPLFGVGHEPLAQAAARPRVKVRKLWLPTSVITALDAAVPFDLWTGRVDLFHGTNYALPAMRRAPGIVTIHDLAVLRFPEQVTPDFSAWFRRTVGSSAPRAARVIADSEFTAKDVVHLLGVPREKVTTIYPGVGDPYFAAGDPDEDRGRLGDRYGISFPIVL